MQDFIFYTFFIIICIILPLLAVRFIIVKSRKFKEIRMYFSFFTEQKIKNYAVIECIDVLDFDIEGYVVDDANQIQSSWKDKAYAIKESTYNITCNFKYLTGGGVYNRNTYTNKSQKVFMTLNLEKGKLYRLRILEHSAVFNKKVPYKINLSIPLDEEKMKMTVVFEERV